MATITAGDANNLNFDQFSILNILQGPITNQSVNGFTSAAGGTFAGTGFTYDAAGDPVSGTITRFEAIIAGQTDMIISDFQMSLATLRSFQSPLNNRGFFAAILAGNDRIEGSDVSNTADVFEGFNGNDSIYGGSGNDTLRGDAGNDTLNSGAGSDSLAGGAGNDIYVVQVQAIVDETGGSGIDTVVVETGDFDLLISGRGGIENLVLNAPFNATLSGNDINNRITGNDFNSTLSGAGGNDVIDARGGQDSLSGGIGNDMLNGGDGNDSLSGGFGRDMLRGGNGDDVYEMDDQDRMSEAAGGGTDLVRYNGTRGSFTLGANVENLELGTGLTGTGNVLANRITGNISVNKLSGRGGDDTLEGRDGADTLDGGAGADSLSGGAGADLYIVDNAKDFIEESNTDFGFDTVRSSVDIDLSAAAGRATGRIENIILTGKALTATGNNFANVIIGTTAGNTLIGLDGDDRLDGGAGADTMFGNGGNDTYVIDSVRDVINDDGGDPFDSIFASISIDLSAGAYKNIEFVTLVGSKALNVTGNDQGNELTGNAGANRLSGGGGLDVLIGLAGNDTLDGGAGDDILSGGAGNDTFIVDSTLEVVIGEQAGRAGGIDTVFSSADDYELSSNVENLVLLAGALAGSGNDLSNVITGNDAANFLGGRGGRDTLRGGAGDDTLDGGTIDKDSMAGGAGSDTYEVDDGDIVSELGGATGGIDFVEYFGQTGFVLGANIENLILRQSGLFSFGIGNNLNNAIEGSDASNRLSGLGGNDSLTGVDGDDTLDGGGGTDTLSGGVGNDAYTVDSTLDIVEEAGGNGFDTVRSSVSFNLTANGTTVTGDLESLVLTGNRAINGTGNGQDNTIEGNVAVNVLDGGVGNDSLKGGAGNDRLIGGADAGADTLDGGTGADTLEGGDGNDIYLVDNAKDKVVETSAAISNDFVVASVSYVLSDNIEGLTLIGAAISGTGNAQGNGIIGNGMANKLFGLDSADTLTGNLGNDSLDGGIGVDVLGGGDGNDTYFVDSVADVVDESTGSGIDTVVASVSFSLAPAAAAAVENLTLAAGAGDIDATGNGQNNRILGNEGRNVLNGADGNDTISGNGGSDFLSGGAGGDSLDGGAGDDSIAGSTGDDTLAGGTGNDRYFYDSTLDAHDLIRGFDGNAAGGQDTLDLEALFDTLGTATVDREGRVQVTDRGANVDVRIDTDGDGVFDLFAATLQTADAITVGADIIVGTL